MSNASMKEQLEAVASKRSSALEKTPPVEVKPNKHKIERAVNTRKTKKPKQGWLDYVQYGVELLRAYFPAAFKAGKEIKPLKIGIKQDLVLKLSTMNNITIEDKACMVKSLGYYVNTTVYHKNIVEGVTRIDLDGHSSGIVSSEEAKYSIDRQHARLNSKPNTHTQ